MTTTTTADRYKAMVPFDARVAPEVLALCRSLHEMDLGCDRPFTGCDLPDHEEDALALVRWLAERDFEIRRRP